MKKALLMAVLVFTIMLQAAFATTHAETGKDFDVFWSMLEYNGSVVDRFSPPPLRSASSPEEGDPEKGYENDWVSYLYRHPGITKWNGIAFDVSDCAPNYDTWVSMSKIFFWETYFREMYNIGGAENPLAHDDYVDFWAKLEYEGGPINPFEAPPNYEPTYDCWKDERDEIGYHWYWQYYFGSQHNYMTGEAADLKWNGVAFDVTSCPENYVMDADVYWASRGHLGYLEYWADYFLGLQ